MHFAFASKKCGRCRTDGLNRNTKLICEDIFYAFQSRTEIQAGKLIFCLLCGLLGAEVKWALDLRMFGWTCSTIKYAFYFFKKCQYMLIFFVVEWENMYSLDIRFDFVFPSFPNGLRKQERIVKKISGNIRGEIDFRKAQHKCKYYFAEDVHNVGFAWQKHRIAPSL